MHIIAFNFSEKNNKIESFCKKRHLAVVLRTTDTSLPAGVKEQKKLF